MNNWIHELENTFVLNVKVKLYARETGVLGEKDGWLEIGVKEPPEKGKANKALITYLSKRLRIAKSEIQLIRGKTQTRKVLSIEKKMCLVDAVKRLTQESA